MKLAFVSTSDIRDVRKYSGTPYYMAEALEQYGIDFNSISPLKTRLPLQFKLQAKLGRLIAAPELSSRFNIHAAKNYAQQIQQRLSGMNVQAVMAHVVNPIAYLDCQQPLVLWTDALYAGLLGFIENFSNHSAGTVHAANELTRAALERCRLAIFSSDWAARVAMEIYGISKEKIKVVPFGANMHCNHTLADIRAMLKRRSHRVVKLLFLGKEWDRKGADIVFKVTKALHAAGQPVELNFVGCQVPAGEEIPDYIKCHGFISKSDAAGVATMTALLQESHFLFVPSRAEAFGIVFCEANAFGLPCLTSYVGGISTIVKDHVNGMTFALGAPIDVYCDYIIGLMRDYSRYEELALAAFNEYETRLNWGVAAGTVKQLIAEIL